MWFTVSQAGETLRSRRYVFSDAFAVISYAAFAKSSHDPQAPLDLTKSFARYLHYSFTLGMM